jgi:guanyl-specific ribonuclease Sa
LLALIVLVAALAVGYTVRALDTHSATIPTVSLKSLPLQVSVTVHRIEDGGPFPYPYDDGVVFHNYEHQLPAEPDGYYHEYTVPTPGSADRGTRRIVTAENGSFYYTSDHYETFERLAQPR